MRVAIDTTYAHRAPFSGTGIYIERLCQELSRMDEVELVTAVNERRRPPAGGGLGSVRNLLDDLDWETRKLPRHAGAAGAQLIHHPLPARSIVARVPQVVTVVDLAFERLPDHFDRGYRTFAHLSHRAAARSAKAVICISQTTASDVRELWRIPRERIVVAPLGPGQELARDAGPRPDPSHFLYVGDDQPRKSLPTLLAAYQRYRAGTETPLELVLAGAVELAPTAGVRVAPRPGRELLAELYLGAVALVHPSLYEGFGLTTLEAMSLGTPVLAASSPGVVEVCADAASYAAPRDVAAFASQMTELAASARLRGQLAERGRRRAAEFSWARCARAHLEAYSLAIER